MAEDTEVKNQMEELVDLNKQLLAKNAEQAETIAKMQKDIDDLLAKADDEEEGGECELESGGKGVMKGGKCVPEFAKAEVPAEVQKALDSQSEEIKKQATEIAKFKD